MKKWIIPLAMLAGLVAGNADADTWVNRLKTFSGTTSQWPWQLNADGTWTSRQPAFTDLSGLATSAQMPAFTGGDCTSSAGGVLLACAPITPVTYASKLGCVADGTTDNSANSCAINIAALTSTGASIVFATGTYKFGSQLVLSNVLFGKSIHFIGYGSQYTTLYWPNATGGISCTVGDAGGDAPGACDAKGLSFVTNQANGGAAFHIVGQDTGGTSPCMNTIGVQNNFYDVEFRGYDRASGSGSKYWSYGIWADKVSNVNVSAMSLLGAPGSPSLGIGYAVNGGTTCLSVMHNISNSIFSGFGEAVSVGAGAQGVTFTQTNAVGGAYGVSIGGANTDQVTIGPGVQFDTTATSVVVGSPGTFHLQITGALISPTTGQKGVDIEYPCYACNITGSNFAPAVWSNTASTAIYVNAACTACNFISNSIHGFTTGINLTSNASGSINVAANVYDTVGTNFANSSSVTTGLTTPDIWLPHYKSSLGSNVSLNNTGNYFLGPSVAQGTSGYWQVTACVTVQDAAGSATYLAKLSDGTTVFASTEVSALGGANQVVPICLTGALSNPAGNIGMYVRDASSTSGSILYNITGNAMDSQITAVRLF